MLCNRNLAVKKEKHSFTIHTSILLKKTQVLKAFKFFERFLVNCEIICELKDYILKAFLLISLYISKQILKLIFIKPSTYIKMTLICSLLGIKTISDSYPYDAIGNPNPPSKSILSLGNSFFFLSPSRENSRLK